MEVAYPCRSRWIPDSDWDLIDAQTRSRGAQDNLGFERISRRPGRQLEYLWQWISTQSALRVPKRLTRKQGQKSIRYGIGELTAPRRSVSNKVSNPENQRFSWRGEARQSQCFLCRMLTVGIQADRGFESLLDQSAKPGHQSGSLATIGRMTNDSGPSELSDLGSVVGGAVVHHPYWNSRALTVCLVQNASDHLGNRTLSLKRRYQCCDLQSDWSVT